MACLGESLYVTLAQCYLFIYFFGKKMTQNFEKNQNEITLHSKKYEHYILTCILIKEWQRSHCIRVYMIYPLRGIMSYEN